MKILLIVFLALLLTACCNTQDPTKGGLCGGIGGLSSGNYDKRIEEREKNLEAINAVIEDEKERNEELQYTKAQQEREIVRLKSSLADMKNEIAYLHTRINTTTKEKDKLLARIRVVEEERKIVTAKLSSPSPDVDLLKAEEARLRKELDDLHEILKSLGV